MAETATFVLKLPETAIHFSPAQSMTELVDSTMESVKRISTELRLGILAHLGLTSAIEWQA